MVKEVSPRILGSIVEDLQIERTNNWGPDWDRVLLLAEELRTLAKQKLKEERERARAARPPKPTAALTARSSA